jgi:hypothetical protein
MSTASRKAAAAADAAEADQATASRIAPLGQGLADELIGLAFAVCDEQSVAQPMGVIVGRIVEPSCCIFQRIDGSLGMVPTNAFTVRSPQVGREPDQVVLYRSVDEMTTLLNPPPVVKQSPFDAGDGGSAGMGGAGQ